MRTDRLAAMVLAGILAGPAAAVAAEAVAASHAPAQEAGASGRSSQAQAEIPFASLGGIYDWAADGDRGIYIQSVSRQWYYAKLFAACINLPFAIRVGFVTEPGSGNFGRFSSILVRGQECPVVSLTKSGPPPSKDHRWRSRQPTHEASGGRHPERGGTPR